jgi:2-C-methyl-D-erythritol 4-phosphate cytidylyltransferase/2-C-methyl-D-erythritol 2,4-cyclodiphosphate synthase
MKNDGRAAAVVTAGGLGRRMGSAVPKQFLKVNGRTILEASVRKFLDEPAVGRIVVTCPEDYLDTCRALFPQTDVAVIPGGRERQDSVANALGYLEREGPPEEIVLIHDGVRPFVDPETIRGVIDAAETSGAAIAAVPSKDTIRDIDQGTLTRSRLYNVQTPQGFRFSLLREAFRRAAEDGFRGTDEAGLVERIGVLPAIVPGSYENIKITTPEDIPERGEGMRIGTGFDVHRLTAGRRLVLCGVEIPYALGLLGHSDADAALHALMDAMLGALGLGDIGVLFPDTDPEYAGASSLDLLEEVNRRIREEGYEIGNADVTILCQAPKLRPYIPAMRKNIAEQTGVSEEQISVKATTTEKLGFTGRGEGIAAEAVCLLRRPG